ncbi:hypothetical protein BDF20DRAFT_839239 [Mycotypha africana]|uniref:uncharacterized protein n=1 Tax=Mycotypha africana TaxID=64632 RepID=UPI002301F8B0|nr:uncharacterized protein BDF20DRAFT_839239 [Mycotypha africana]KAI8969307.1 hypothetical protein BDF20DRAFT_839239 [Mycotypha africana]
MIYNVNQRRYTIPVHDPPTRQAHIQISILHIITFDQFQMLRAPFLDPSKNQKKERYYMHYISILQFTGGCIFESTLVAFLNTMEVAGIVDLNIHYCEFMERKQPIQTSHRTQSFTHTSDQPLYSFKDKDTDLKIYVLRIIDVSLFIQAHICIEALQTFLIWDRRKKNRDIKQPTWADTTSDPITTNRFFQPNIEKKSAVGVMQKVILWLHDSLIDRVPKMSFINEM